jgi:hypothetical protein
MQKKSGSAPLFDVMEFYITFARMTGKQLDSIKGSMEKAVVSVMDTVTIVNQLLEKASAEAEAELLATHLNPDKDRNKAMNDIQSSVDDIFAAAQADMAIETNDDDDRKNRLGGKFAKEKESIYFLAKQTTDPLMVLMGSLSIEDVVGQRLANVGEGLREFTVSLSKLITLRSEGLSPEQVRDLEQDLKTWTHARLTSTREVEVFNQFYKDVKLNGSADKDSSNFSVFITRYLSMLAMQLNEVRKQVSDSVAKAIDSVMALNKLLDENKSRANTALVKGKVGEAFVATTMQELDKAGCAIDSAAFKSKNDNLADICTAISQSIMDMMGDLSIEDVIAQRLEHIVHSFENLSKISASLSSLLAETNVEEKFETISIGFLRGIIKSYTMVSEKVVLTAYFPSVQKIPKAG